MASMTGDGSTQRLVLNVSSSPANLSSTRRAIESFAQSCGFDEASRDELGLVINEAMANVIRHAYSNRPDQPIAVTAECVDEALWITLRDWGSGVNPMALPRPERDPLCPGGLGIVCMCQLMDEIEFVVQPDGMLLRMCRRKDRPARSCKDARDAC